MRRVRARMDPDSEALEKGGEDSRHTLEPQDRVREGRTPAHEGSSRARRGSGRDDRLSECPSDELEGRGEGSHPS
jgi:hypothetical protein